MKMIFKTLKGIVLTALLIGCTTDDFVDIQPAFSVNSENYFNSEDDYQLALIAAYDQLQTTYLNVMLGEMASDNTLAGGENANDVPAFQEIDDMTHTPVNDQLRRIWSWMYAGITRTNYIFEFKDKTDFEGKAAVLAQNYFLRAYYYFELVKFFGDVPMPLDKRVSFNEVSDFPRLPKSDVYAQIEADLLLAIADLPVTQADAGRVTKGAAQSLLGKVYLYQDKFTEAGMILEEVINSGVYDLQMDYEGLFLASGENGMESVFEVQYSDLQGGGFGCFQCVEGNIAVGFNGIRGYSGPVYADGFSFNVPTQELVDEFESGDIRFSATILDIENFAAAQSEEVQYSEGFEHTGYYNQKYIPRAGEQSIGDTHLTSNKNYRAIRYSDVLLMAAEALNRGGVSDDRAQTYLNMVRTRAELADVNATGASLTAAIYHERRMEMAGEGHRFFDLVRTNRAADEIDDFVAGKHEVFPIPLIEIQLAGNIWTQNPNY